jgi:hypothetical protein
MDESRVCVGLRMTSSAICKRLLVPAVGACIYVMAFGGSAAAAIEPCPNAALRVGPSAALPECRAYELVTPADLGRTGDMTFTGNDRAIPSGNGEHLALEAIGTPLEPQLSASANVNGTDAVFSRTLGGWTMRSATAPGRSADRLAMRLLSPDLSQVGLVSYTALNSEEVSEDGLEVGPVGGPYALVTTAPNDGQTVLIGANGGTLNVPAFTNVLLESTDAKMLALGAERAHAEEAVTGFENLYVWSGGHLRLVNVNGEGKLISRCGATLGIGRVSEGEGSVGAVSADGSKIFFESPLSNPPTEEVACKESSRLYMRVAGNPEPVEVSAPQGVELAPSERKTVRYAGATPDGSEVFFDTATPLTAGETPIQRSGEKLFEYDTEAREGERLKLIATGVVPSEGSSNKFLVSEDGSTVYYQTGSGIYHYDTRTGETSFVAIAASPLIVNEASYAAPNGQFLVFVGGPGGVEVAGSRGLEPERRGKGHNELYRYDAADGSVMCVSCGEGVAPAHGEMQEPANSNGAHALLGTQDETPPFVQMTDNGQEVFFQTVAQLVPQDRNSTEEIADSKRGLPGLDVYEWEADGVEEAPGAFCRVAVGCTHLISSGEDVGPAFFLGASRDGNNVFFSSASQLVPQATPEFSNIYDARVDGGFPPPLKAPECLSCQGVGGPPPLFGPGSSLTFAGASNPASTPGIQSSSSKPTKPPTAAQKLAKALRTCRRRRKRARISCERKARRTYRRSK